MAKCICSTVLHIPEVFAHDILGLMKEEISGLA